MLYLLDHLLDHSALPEALSIEQAALSSPDLGDAQIDLLTRSAALRQAA